MQGFIHKGLDHDHRIKQLIKNSAKSRKRGKSGSILALAHAEPEKNFKTRLMPHRCASTLPVLAMQSTHTHIITHKNSVATILHCNKNIVLPVNTMHNIRNRRCITTRNYSNSTRQSLWWSSKVRLLQESTALAICEHDFHFGMRNAQNPSHLSQVF